MRILLAVVLAGCGRIGFEAERTAGDGGGSGGGDAGTTGLQMVACNSVSAGNPAVCNGLVALLHFDRDPAFGETDLLAYDFAGRNNNATCVSPDCPTYTPNGRFGGAFAYTEPQAFSIANGPSVSISGAVTMSAWFYPNTMASNWRVVITKIQASPLVANYGIPHNGGDLCVNFCKQSTGWQNHCAPTTYVPGRWYHLVGVIDDTNDRATLYVDGVKVVDDVEPMAMEQDGGSVWIGWSPTNFGVDGIIDEVAIWNRALSAAEVATLY